MLASRAEARTGALGRAIALTSNARWKDYGGAFFEEGTAGEVVSTPAMPKNGKHYLNTMSTRAQSRHAKKEKMISRVPLNRVAVVQIMTNANLFEQCIKT